MLGFVTRLVADRGGVPDGTGRADELRGRQSARLFECPDCESVYLSEELASCRSCDTDVEPVPTERDLEHVSSGDEA